MSRKPSIAVIIPAYNCELFITEALQSVESQTRQPDRVVVIDDGSTDGTSTRILDFGKQTTLNFRFLAQANAGAATARNTGLAECKEELIAFLDADDTLYPTFLERSATALERHTDLILCFPDRDVIDENGNVIRRDLDDPKFRAMPARALGDGTKVLISSPFTTLAAGSVIPMGFMTRHTVLQEVGGFDEDLRAAEDKLLLMQLAKLGTFGFIDEPLGTWRRHTTNTSGAHNAFRMSFNGDLALAKLEQNADKFNLTPDELSVIQATRRRASPRILYAASNEAHPQFFKIMLRQLTQRKTTRRTAFKACIRYGMRRCQWPK